MDATTVTVDPAKGVFAVALQSSNRPPGAAFVVCKVVITVS